MNHLTDLEPYVQICTPKKRFKQVKFLNFSNRYLCLRPTQHFGRLKHLPFSSEEIA